MKKIISLILTFCMLVTPVSVFGANGSTIHYDENELQSVIDTYNAEESELEIAGNREALSYLSLYDYYNSHQKTKWLYDTGSNIIEVTMTEEDYAVLLALIMENNYQTVSEQVADQETYSVQANEVDMITDFTEIMLAGLNKEIVSTIFDVTQDALGFTIDAANENYDYYLAVSGSYGQNEAFLTAVYNNSDKKELKEAAKELLTANKQLFTAQLDYLYSNAEDLGEIEVNLFMDKLVIPLFKETEEYGKNGLLTYAVDGLEKFKKEVLDKANTFFNLGMFMGNYGFGTSGQFDCYQHFMAMGQIEDAISKELDKIVINTDDDLSDQYRAIMKKCYWYKLLITSDVFGESYVYSMLSDENNLLSNLDYIISYVKSEENYDDWYNKQMTKLQDWQNIITGLQNTNVIKFETPENNTAENLPAEDNTDNISADWQQAYYDYLQPYCTGEEFPETFALAYIDGDEIPELVMGYNGTDRTERVSLYTYYQGQVCSLGEVGTYSTLEYTERANYIKQEGVSNGGTRNYTTVLSIIDGSLQPVFICAWAENTSSYCQCGTSEDTMEDVDYSVIESRLAEYFPDGQVKTTPNLSFGETVYRCTAEEISNILSNPDAVTI